MRQAGSVINWLAINCNELDYQPDMQPHIIIIMIIIIIIKMAV